MNVGIYKITSPSGRVYIGQSINIKKRFSRYKAYKVKSQKAIYNSLVKYGVENHKFDIIHELPVDVTQEVLDNYEILYMKMYKDCGVKLLNIKSGGKNGAIPPCGRKMTDNHKKILSDSMKGNNRGNKKIKVTNLQTGKIMIFTSLKETTCNFNISEGTLLRYLKGIRRRKDRPNCNNPYKDGIYQNNKFTYL